MKNAIIVILGALVAALLLFGCSQSNTQTASDEPSTDGPESTEPVSDEGDQASESASSTSADASNDTTQMFEVSEDTAKSRGGFYLKRGDTFYTLQSSIPERLKGVDYTAGRIEEGTGGKTVFYEHQLDIVDGAYSSVITYGDFDPIVVEPGDMIVAFDPDRIPDLQLQSMQFYGYSIGYVEPSSYYGYTNGWIWDSDMNFTSMDAHNVSSSDVSVQDASGSEVPDYRNLGYGDQCKVSWAAGTAQQEVTSTANCRYYKYTLGHEAIYKDDSEYTISGEATTDGYAVYDISAVEPGIYKVYGGGIVVIG